jgi:beta propeller repeat protein
MKKFTSISTTTLVLILMAWLVTNGAIEKPICTDLNDQRYPAISGNLILWTDIRKGKWNTYMYDLSTSNKNRITSGLNSQRYPAISGDRIIWEDYRDGNGDIYMYDLSLAPILRLPASRSNSS